MTTDIIEKVLKEYQDNHSHFELLPSECKVLMTSAIEAKLKELRKKIEVKRQKLIELVKSDRKLEKHMSKIKRTDYELGYADAAYKGRISELLLIEQIQREILGEEKP